MEDPLIETWAIHNRINLYFIDALSEETLGVSLPPRSRTVYELFAHMHNVRLMWLKAAAPERLEGLEKLESKTPHAKEALKAALERSGQAIAEMLRQAVAAGGKVKNFKPHATAFVGYLISHESHHRGQIGWTLKQAGSPLDKKTSFGLWEWGVR